MLRNTAINTAKLICVVYFVFGVRFGPKRDGLAVLMFGNEVVSSVLGEVGGGVIHGGSLLNPQFRHS